MPSRTTRFVDADILVMGGGFGGCGAGPENRRRRKGDPLAGLLLPRRPSLVDPDWHVFSSSQYDAKTGEWQMTQLPVHHIIS